VFRTIPYAGARLRKLAGELPYLTRALALVWGAAPRLTVAWLALLLAQAIIPVATVYLTRSLVNQLMAIIRSEGSWTSFRPLLFVLGLMAAALVLNEVLRSLVVWLRSAQAEHVRDHISRLIYEKSTSVDLAHYDWPEFYNQLERARSQSPQVPLLLLESLGGILQSGATLIAMGAVLVPYGVWLPPALIVATVPALYTVLRSGLRQHEWRRRTTADERRLWYYDWLLTNRENAQEVRLFDLGACFRLAHQALRARLRKENLGLAREQSVLEFGAALAGFLVMGASVGWIIWRAVHGRSTLGDVALFYQAFNQGLGLMRALLENMGRAYANTLFLRNLFEFLALQPQIISPPKPTPVPTTLQKGISFRQVSFRYPGSDRLILRKLDLFIPAGQIGAVIGRNGAGKSTIAKLLCRFYDPDEGAIELDGVDLRRFSVPELRRRISALFQQPVHYAATVMQNIVINSSGRLDEEIAKRAAGAAGAEQMIAQLPQGYDTPLSTWLENGAELSIGEWQRIALARGFCREAPIFLMDEPTSAMDPWAESEWGRNLREVVTGRTTLLITHRLTTAAFADVIYVLDGGHVVQCGSHQQLLESRGPYAQVWSAWAPV
jgi:ATP-binding cassette subfamily B protein